VKTKLKPCPFCGRIPQEWISDTPVPFVLYDIIHKKSCFLYQDDTHFEGADGIATLHKSGLTKWNRRK